MARASKQKVRTTTAAVEPTPAHDTAQHPVLALAAITAIGALLRLWYLRQPIRYDEAVTYLIFARLPWLDVIADYRYPNNHVFHTLLVKLSVSVFGNEPWALRLPAFLAGVAIIPAAYFAAREVYGQRVALVTAALIAGCGALTLYATNARGYTIVVLATLILFTIAARARRSTSVAPWCAYAAVGGLGLWTVPIMLYPLGGVSLWFAMSVWQDRAHASVPARHLVARVAGATAGAGALAVLLYTPVLLRSGLLSLVGNPYVTPSPLPVFLDGLPEGFTDAARFVIIGVWWPVALALALCVAVGVAYHKRWTSLLASPVASMAVWCALLLVVSHRIPFARVWLFVVPLLCMLAAAGAVALLSRPLARSRRGPLLASAFAVVAAAGLSAVTVVSGDVGTSERWETFVDAEAVARALAPQLRAGDRIVGAIPKEVTAQCADCGYSAMQLSYWFDKLGVDSAVMTIPAEQARRILLVVNMYDGDSTSPDALRQKLAGMSGPSAPSVLAEFPHALVLAVSPGEPSH